MSVFYCEIRRKPSQDKGLRLTHYIRYEFESKL
jgi:hypothetical protein